MLQEVTTSDKASDSAVIAWPASFYFTSYSRARVYLVCQSSMADNAPTTRSQAGSESGRDAQLQLLDYVLNATTGVITKPDGTDEQMWVLIMAPQSREDRPLCGAILDSNADGGELPCLHKVSNKSVGVDAMHRHDVLDAVDTTLVKRDTVRTCWSHRGMDGSVSK